MRVRGPPPMYTPILLTIMTAVLYECSIEDKISDACHGRSEFPQTHNMLECDEGTQICITDVRYFRWDTEDQVCPRLLSTPVSDRCCRRNTSRCSWVRSVSDHSQELRRNCTGQSRCDLHSSSSEITADPCIQLMDANPYSSVRSITYTCTSSGACSPLERTTNSANSTGGSEESSSVKTSNTGAIVGGVIGGLLICALIVGLLVFVWKKRSTTKPRIPQTDSRSDDVTEIQIVSRPSAGYENIGSRYSFYQPERDDNSTSWNHAAETNVSELYSKVDKTKKAVNTPGQITISGATTSGANHHGNYDRVQGEAAHFKVHGDYDHVTRHSYGESSSDDITGGIKENADVDMTYNQLHRGGAAPARTETEVDPYDVLNRANARTT